MGHVLGDVQKSVLLGFVVPLVIVSAVGRISEIGLTEMPFFSAKSTDGSYCCITPGKDHEQAAAPCYEMYYVWLIRHNDGDPWYKTTRIVGDEHQWIVNAK